MKKIYLLVIILATLCVGFGIGCFYQCGKSKVAIVDIQTIVAKSEQVQDFKDVQTIRAKEFDEWLQYVQKKVDEESDETKKNYLLKKYSTEFNAQKNEMQKQYTEKLDAIEKNIKQTIIDEAKKKGYKLVISKGVTIYGGDDITDDIAEIVK